MSDDHLTLKLTHPRYHLPKTYLVTLKGSIDDEKLQQWAEGLMLEGKKTLPADIILNERNAKHTKIKIILQEGRNRQIRKIGELLGHPVITLQVSPLPLGKHRFLSKEEVAILKKNQDKKHLQT